MSILRLDKEHAYLLYPFMVANSANGIFSHHKRGAEILTDDELGNLYLGDMLALGVLQKGKLVQLVLTYADGSNNLIARYIYGSYNAETPELLDAIRKYAIVMYPNIDQYTFVFPTAAVDQFMAAWDKTKLSKQASPLIWNDCFAKVRPGDYWLRDTILGCGVPCCDLYTVTTSINYSEDEYLP